MEYPNLHHECRSILLLLLLAVSSQAAAPDPAQGALPFKVTVDFPGGNCVIEKIENNMVTLRPDLRDTSTWWFYWCFRVQGAAGRTLTFRFSGRNPLGVLGPAVCADPNRPLEERWQWLPDSVTGKNAFQYAFKPGEDDVAFCFGMPYARDEWNRFLKGLESSGHVQVAELCKTRKGRSVPHLLLSDGSGDAPYRVLVTCRHHACEMMASHVLEGLLAYLSEETPDAAFFRSRAELMAVPFMDLDGVADGDQGKNRKPHDHNRDYLGESIYPSVRALREKVPDWIKGKRTIALDLHCPYIRGTHNEVIYQVGSPVGAIWAAQTHFGGILEETQTGPIKYRVSDNLPFGKAWNTAANVGKHKSFAGWARELPGIALASTFEIPYANAGGRPVTVMSARLFGCDVGRALCEYLRQSLPVERRPFALHLAAPIKTWDEAVMLGNGLTGGLLWGEDNIINLSLDRGDLWDERLPALYLEKDWTYATLRRLVAQRNQAEIVRRYDTPYNQIPYPTKLPGGRLVITLDAARKVRRFSLDMKRALGSARLTQGGLTSFFSAVEPVAMVKISGPPASYRFVRPAGLDRLGYAPAAFGKKDGITWMTQSTVEGLTYAVVVGEKRLEDHSQLAITITSTKDGPEPLAAGKARVRRALDAGFTAMLEKHQAWWRDFWSVSDVRIPHDGLQHHYNLVKYFYGAASRPDAPPMPLQGVWTRDDGGLPPWKGDYHHDLNTQMTYVAYHTAGLFDAGKSFLNYNWRLLPQYRRFARSFYDVAGASVPGVATLSGKPTAGWSQYALSPTNGLWIGHIFALHWEYTLDKAFLREQAYPWLKAVAEGVVNLLEEKDGKLYLPLSTSPEIYNNSLRAWLPPNSNHDLALLRWTFKTLAGMAETLGLGDDAAHWRSLFRRLDPPAVDDKQVLCFARGMPFDQSQRHHAHTMDIHPLGLLTIEGNDRDRAIIDATVDRIHEMGTQAWVGFSFSWFACLLARVGRAELALKYLADFERAFILRNGFHANGDQIGAGLSGFRYRPFTLEGNFLAMEAVHEMLLQSWGGKVRIFPAVSRKWADVSFEKLRARGGFKVSAVRENGQTKQVTVEATVNNTLVLKDPFDGKPVQWNLEDVLLKDGHYHVPLKKGQVLSGKPAEKKKPGLELKNGWFVHGDRLVWGFAQHNGWWRAGQRPNLTRRAPGKVGPNRTEDLDKLTSNMVRYGYPGFEHNFGLWYDRRRDAHDTAKRRDGRAVPPFLEQPWARSTRGRAWDGLPRYDLTRFNAWYFDRLAAFADLCGRKGGILLHNFYMQHVLLETNAHYVDFAWRPVNCIQDTGMPDRNPSADAFYDVSHPKRRALHRAYIRHCLDRLGSHSNVLHLPSLEYTGPADFVSFWLDKMDEWAREHKKDMTKDIMVGLGATRDVLDRLAGDPRVRVLDLRYWWYRPDGSLMAPAGGRQVPGRFASGHLAAKTTPQQIYRQVRAYRLRYPEKGIIHAIDASRQQLWAFLMAGGSLLVHRLEEPGGKDMPGYRAPMASALIMPTYDFLNTHLSSALPATRPVDWVLDHPDRNWCLSDGATTVLVYALNGGRFRVDLSRLEGPFIARWFNPRTGELRRAGDARLSGGKVHAFQGPDKQDCVLWLSRL